MNGTHLATAIALLTAAIAGCDRNAPNTGSGSVDLQKLPAQAERQLEKAGAALDDAAVTAKVKTALIAEPRIKGLAIDVDTSQNVVTLSGTVASNDLREEAERVARKVEGVKGVTNNLVVKQPS